MVKWIIQSNLIKTETLEEFRKSFVELTISFEEIKVVPFSNELPPFTPSEINIFYGSTTLLLNAYNSKNFREGVFYDSDLFSIDNYLRNWKDKMLNFGGSVMKLKDFISGMVDSKPKWFIRPNEDTKSFSGTTMTSQEIKEWYSKILTIDNPDLNADTLIFASEEKKIIREWRNFIVNGKVVDSSRYVLNGELNVSRSDLPVEMISFAEVCANEYSPHKIFVMDVAEIENGFKIIECNSFNGTGFYDHDIKKIVKAITDFTKSSA